MKNLIDKLNAGTDLEPSDVASAVAQLTSTDYPDIIKAEFLTALAAKGERPSEVAAFAEEFLSRAVDPKIDPTRLAGPLIDVCGTGGDRLGLFNVSTTVCFVLAAGGLCVAKHGNRGVSSRSGGADVLEALGVNIELAGPAAAACLEQTGLVFLFAQRYHPAFKAIAPVRRELAGRGITTIFNILGPLLNPARPQYQMAGLFRADMVGDYADVLIRLGRRRALVVSGFNGDSFGMDEISPAGPTQYALRSTEQSHTGVFTPSEFGIDPFPLEGLIGGDATENAAILTRILDGTDRGERRLMVEINAAGAFLAAGVVANPKEGRTLAAEMIDSGKAAACLAAQRSFA